MKEENKFYYEALGLSPEQEIGLPEIEKVYRRLYTQFHSEKEGEIKEEKKVLFERITEAYEKIIEDKKKSNLRGKFDSSKNRSFRNNSVDSRVLEVKRVVKATKGGRRFSFSTLLLLRNANENSVGFSYQKGKQISNAIQKAQKQGQKNLVNYWKRTPRTIPHEVTVKYKATKIFVKPTPVGSGIKAGGVLNMLFKFLEIKDVTAKIIGSRNKMNVIKASFLVLGKLTGKNYFL